MAPILLHIFNLLCSYNSKFPNFFFHEFFFLKKNNLFFFLGRGGARGRRERREVYDVVPTRPAALVDKRGTSGAPVELMSNYLGFKKSPDTCLYKYRVDFRSKVQGELETYTKKKLFGRLAQRLPPYLFDGSMLYLPSKVTGNLLISRNF